MSPEFKQALLKYKEYFDSEGYTIISKKVRPLGLHILAKHPNGNNETFRASVYKLEKFVHTTRDKKHPWDWETVIQLSGQKESYLDEMRQAIENEQKEKTHQNW